MSESTSINLVVVRTGNDPHDAEKLTNLFVKLHRLRLPVMTPFSPVKFFLYAESTEGVDLETLEVEHIPLELRDSITDPEYYKLDIFKSAKFSQMKTIVFDLNLLPQDLSQVMMINGVPHKGDLAEAEGLNLPSELKVRIVEEKLPFLQCAYSWWNPESPNKTCSWYYSFIGAQSSDLFDLFNEDPEKYINEYADKGGLAGFIENNYKGVLIPCNPGYFIPYYCGNKEKNVETVALWEKEVTPYFPEKYDGQGADMEDPMILWEHEWKTFQKQVRFIYADEATNPREKDLYLLKWAM
jgi:hypothetical protein